MSHAGTLAPAPTSEELQHQLLMYAQDLHDLMQQQSQLQHRHLCASTDVSLRASEAEVTARLAYYDTVTGFANRHLLQKRLTQALAQAGNDGTGPCLLLIELDEFKLISEAFGAAVSDRFLQQIGTRLLGALAGHIVARTGDDQFAILLQGPVDEARARDLAETLRQRLSTPIRVDQHEVTVGVGIGCARHPQHGADLSALLRHADRTMFERSRYATN
jgi:diguanylate cyclase (GGDEF)-like protein